MRPSETLRAKRWLEQFESDDQDTAARLLDAIVFVPGGEVLASVRGNVEDWLQEERGRLPAAIVPILAQEDMQPLMGAELPSEPSVFTDFDPSQDSGADAGSEALVGYVIREIRKSQSRRTVLPSPVSLKELHDSRARTLLMLTDYIGSGRQVLDYVAAWHRHPTIRSWRSFGLLHTVVVAYAATMEGKRFVETTGQVDELRIVRVVPAMGDGAEGEWGGLASLCRLYARRGRLRRPPLGFGGSGGLFATSFSVPNNLPAVLIERSTKWEPFFSGRSVPDALAREIQAHEPERDMSEELAGAGQRKLAARLREGRLDRRWHLFLAVLPLAARPDDELSLALGASLAQIRQVRALLEASHLIQTNGRLTQAGLRVLSRHRRKPRVVTADLAGEDSPYYPRLKR